MAESGRVINRSSRQNFQATNRQPTGQRQPMTPKGENALDIWLDLLAEIVVAEVLHEKETDTPR